MINKKRGCDEYVYSEKKVSSESYKRFMFPPEQILPSVPVLRSGGNKPLKLTFGNQMNALILFHLQECDPARHLIQMLNGDDSAKTVIASEYGISRSSFCEAVNRRGLGAITIRFSEAQHTG